MSELKLNFQQRSYWCGVAALQNALHLVGIDRSQSEISKLIVVTAKGETVEDEEAGLGGTPEEELMRGTLACGGAYWIIHEKKSIPAFACLHTALDQHGPVVLCVDEEDHWITAIGRCGGRYLIFDPAKGEGLLAYEAHELSARWRVSEEAGGPYFYALAISK